MSAIHVNGEAPGEPENHIEPVDGDDLYEVRTFTDAKRAEIKCLYPVAADGGPSVGRKPRFFSSCTVMFRGRQVPCNFEIHAGTLQEALLKFPEEAAAAGELLAAKLESNVTRAALTAPSPRMPIAKPS